MAAERPESVTPPIAGLNGAKAEDMALLSQVMEAFNAATVNLQSSYDILKNEAQKLREEVEDKNKKLAELSSLLESVLNNTLSSILVVSGGEVVIKNRAGERLMDELGAAGLAAMLSVIPGAGVLDYEDNSGRYFRLSVGNLVTDNIYGTVIVIDDITELKKLEQERLRGEKLQLMGEMAANIAHEIRNPLGSMELFASLLERDLEGNPEQKRLTSNIIKAVRTINRTISNTLLFTKEMMPTKERYHLADIVDEVVLYLQHALKEKSVTLVNKLNEDDIIDCDKDLFRQVVINLVHNAIDAVDAVKGVIILESHIKDGWLIFSVQDNGAGIADGIKSRLFLPFQTTKAKGTGLGLPIAYRIVKAHGGELDVESGAVNGAMRTSFIVKMPLA